MRRIHFIVVLITALIGFASLPALGQSGRKFYIDYASGSNSNPGTQTAPWKTHPYMQTGASCTGTGSAPSYAHAAGDQFIFKGGVIWPAGCFQMTLQAGGASGNPDYYGADTTWFSGSSFSRPKFDLAQTIPTGGTGGNHVIYGGSTSNVTIDNLEIANQAIAQGSGFGSAEAIQAYGSSGVTIKNCYIHDFITNGQLSSSWTPDYSAGGILGPVTMLNTTIDDTNGFGFNTSGTKITGGYIGGACQNCAEVGSSKFVHTMAACFTVGKCHDNEFTGISQSVFDNPNPTGYADLGSARPHTQIIEDNLEGIGPCGGMAIYNNLIHDNSAGVTMLICYNANVYNNVLWNNSNISILLGPPVPDNSANVGNFYNNTVDCSNVGACIGASGSASFLGTINLKNNHWITNGSAVCINISACITVATLNQNNNLTMSTSTATSQGYTSVNKFAPTTSTNGTVNAALNLSGLCSGTLGSLCADVLHNPRLTSWDAGAYQFGSQSAKPNPPSNLAASVQ